MMIVVDTIWYATVYIDYTYNFNVQRVQADDSTKENTFSIPDEIKSKFKNKLLLNSYLKKGKSRHLYIIFTFEYISFSNHPKL